MTNIKRWLTDEEIKVRKQVADTIADPVGSITGHGWKRREKAENVFKSLAHRAELLDKHQWDGLHTDEMGEPTGKRYCLECLWDEDVGHKSDCPIAAELDGLPRGG